MNTKCKCQRSVKLCQLWFVLISLSLHLRTSYWLQIFPFYSYRERRPLQTWVVMQLPPGTLKTVTCTRVNTDKTTGDKQEECTRRTILYKLSNKSVQLSGSCARAHPKLEAKPATNYFSHLLWCTNNHKHKSSLRIESTDTRVLTSTLSPLCKVLP